MDIIQGSFKDRTQGTRDYRRVSALYLLLRMGLGFFLRCGVFDRLYMQVCIQPIEMAILQYVPSLSRDVFPLHETL